MTLTDEEIRMKVAELMGYSMFGMMDIGLGPRLTAGIYPGQEQMDIIEVPHWPDCPAAALQLCDRMREKGWCVLIAGLDHDEGDKGWTVAVFNGGGNPIEASDPSLARAVTLCFLAAHSNEIRKA